MYQDTTNTSVERHRLILHGLNITDKITTAIGLRLGIAEGNLLMRQTVQYLGLYGCLILWWFLASFGIEQLAEHGQHKWLVALIVLYGITTFFNLWVIIAL